MKILVTGAKGFVGSRIMDALPGAVAALSLPGGCYNFGSGADCTMYDLAQLMKEKMGLQLSLIPGENKGNLWMNQEKLNNAGVYFPDHSEGLLDCLKTYGLI